MILPVLPENPECKKTGCRACPMLAHSPAHADFVAVDAKSGGEYLRNVEAIRKRLYDPHRILTVGVMDRPYKPVDVLFVGDSPDRDADKQNKCFVGRTGHLLRTTVDELFKGAKHTYAYTYVVRCRVPDQQKSLNKTELTACRPELLREIAERKPKVIVAVGATALKVLGGVGGMAQLAGMVLKTDCPGVAETPMIPCPSPGFILMQGNDLELEKFVGAVRQARRVVEGKAKRRGALKDGKRASYRTLTTVDEVRAYVEDALKARVVASDTESATLSPFGGAGDKVSKGAKANAERPRILCYSFCHVEGEGVTIPMDHKDSPFTKDEKRIVRSLVKRLMLSKTTKKVFQHGKHDVKYIRRKDGYWVEAIEADTLYTHQMLDETRGSHSLDRLAYQHTDKGGYEKELEKYIKAHPECDPKKGGSYANIPGRLLFKYAAIDADVTLRSHVRMSRKLRRFNRQSLAVTRRLHPRLLNTLARMEYRGAFVDVKRVRQVKRTLRKRVKRAAKTLRRAKVVRRFIDDRTKDNAQFEFKPNSAVQQRALLFERMGVVSYELTDKGEQIIRARVERLTRQAVKRQEDPPTVEAVVKEAFHKKRQFGLFAVTADVLQGLKGKSDGVAEALLEYREAKTALSTFIDPLESRLDKKHRVHGSFNPDGTSTARLSSSNPNLQNLPTKDKGTVKSCYVSRFTRFKRVRVWRHRRGHRVRKARLKRTRRGYILQADYSQIELRVAASFFDEPKMVQAYVDDADLHVLTALDVFGLTQGEWDRLDPKEQKLKRTMTKRVNFGILYQGGPDALVYTLKKDGVFITREQAEELIRRYFEKRPDLKANIDAFKEQVARDGLYTAFTGYTRRVPDVFSVNRSLVARALRQIVNFPIQHIAGWMTLMSLCVIEQRMRAAKMKSMLILTVHDSIVLDCVEEEVWAVAKLVKDVMENIATYSKEILPRLDWSWLTVPIKAELEVGESWGYAVGFDPAERRDGDLWKDETNDKGKVTPRFLRSPRTVRELRRATRHATRMAA